MDDYLFIADQDLGGVDVKLLTGGGAHPEVVNNLSGLPGIRLKVRISHWILTPYRADSDFLSFAEFACAGSHGDSFSGYPSNCLDVIISN